MRFELLRSFISSLSIRGGWFHSFTLVLLISLFASAPQLHGSETIPSAESVARLALDLTPLTVNGSVIDEYGVPIDGASVQLGAHMATSGSDGTFQFAGITRESRLMKISCEGFRNEFIPIHLYKAAVLGEIIIPPIYLKSSDEQVVRLLFGGDTSFGRRYLDPEQIALPNQVPDDNPDALIQVSNPAAGSMSVLEEIKPLFEDADWSSVNLETPVTDSPATPHPEKAYVFFTLPASLDALNWMGLDYAALGNNHLYDYLDTGLVDTFANLNARSIPFSGGGLSNSEAFAPYREVLKGHNYSFLSMTSVTGNQYSINYVADETKGGAADLTDQTSVTVAIEQEVLNDFIPIVQLHGGKEYTFEPSSYMSDSLSLAANAGARLVIGHHPHVAQGVGRIDDVIVVHSLGNLIFDQDRHETMLGLMARVDMQGATVDSLRLLPVYLEKYVPRLMPERFAEDFLRRIAEFSHGYGLSVFPYNGQGWVVLDPADAQPRDRIVSKTITLPETGSAIVDLRKILASGESLLSVTAENQGLTAKLGRDIFVYGDFEDWDLDSEQLEVRTWDISGVSRYPTVTESYRGAASLASTRSSDNISVSITPFRHRVRVMGDAVDAPLKDLSFLGYLKGEGAGPIRIEARYYASEGDAIFGEEDVVNLGGGTFDWQAISSTMTMPPDDPSGDPLLNPRAVRLFLYQQPPPSGTGYAYFDDLAVIGWEDQIDLSAGDLLETPHARDFLQVNGPPGDYQLSFTFRSFVPAFKTMAGDLDRSKVVGLEDLLLALQVSAGRVSPSEVYKEADVNDDLRIGVEEAIHLLRVLSQ